MVSEPLYSHRQRALSPRDVEVIEEPGWISIQELVRQLISANYLAKTCPNYCDGCGSIVATDEGSFFSLLTREIPRLNHRRFQVPGPLPETDAILDLIELVHNCGAMPAGKYNGRCDFECIAYDFSLSEGRIEFRKLINNILDRERIAFELTESGLIARVGAPILSDVIRDTEFQTSDDVLNELLENARGKFISRDPKVREEGLEKLWDAWERLKTVEPGSDKKASTSALLDGVADGPMRDRLEREAIELTDIGNKFMIRHSEKDRHQLEDDRHVDYLFHRMFSLVYLLLDGTGRVGASK